MPKVTLRIYGVQTKSLKEFHTVDKKKYDIENVPLEENRLYDEEIKGEDAQLQVKTTTDQLSIVNESDEFNFTGSRSSGLLDSNDGVNGLISDNDLSKGIDNLLDHLSGKDNPLLDRKLTADDHNEFRQSELFFSRDRKNTLVKFEHFQMI